MRKARIVMISPLPELTRLTRQISRDQKFELEIVEAFLDKGVEAGKRFEQAGADVIISRGPTGVLLKRELSIPVVLVQMTSFDIIRALYQAKQLGHRIAFFDHTKCKEIYDFKIINEIFFLDNLSFFFYRDEKELEAQIQRAQDEGVEVIVSSGICILRMAKKLGMKGVMAFSSREAVIEALQWAKDVVRIRERDREKAEFLKTIIDHTYMGIIAINKRDEVTHFNPSAEEVFKISGREIIGKKVENLPIPLLRIFFQDSGEGKGEVHRVGGKQILFHRIPIYIDKEIHGMVITFQSVHKIQNLEATIRKKLHNSGLVSHYTFNHLIGSSTEMAKTVTRARKFASSDSTVLIIGESGTGKELFAHSIHSESPRHEGPFVAINCASIPKELLESELFGYEEGSFTGAKKGGKIGLFELAHGGTIFLDEISELSPPLQLNLLRVLQEKVVRRIGGERIIPVDVRVIAATNRFLAGEVKKGTFREDLFFRLNVLNLHLPPLRERRSDIPLLIEHFCRKYEGNKVDLGGFPRSIMRYLCEYDWPGNVRELENFIEKYAFLSEEGADNFRLIEELVDELYRYRDDEPGVVPDGGQYLTIGIGKMDEMERQIIEKLYKQTKRDKKDLARQLGISRTTLWKKLKYIESNPVQ